MDDVRRLTIYLDDASLAQHQAGQHNFFARLTAALRARDWRVDALPATPETRAAAPDQPGYALFHMDEPTHDRALTCRRAYVGAFWRIEATGRRWDWPVAKAQFDPAAIDAAAAQGFARGWRKRLFDDPQVPPPSDLVLIALQGRLDQQRSFQSTSPIAMIETTARHFPDRPLLATLHPNEVHTEAEHSALDQLATTFPNLRIRKGGSDAALRQAGLVVTQNSATAFRGFFLHRPALLFGEVDFHHIAASVPRDGLDRAVQAARQRRPSFDRYLFWFLRQQAINAHAPDTDDQIIAALSRHGWPVA
ncbi:hypothetical protein ACEYYB_12150 [Paracoccus sp. p4-l81]